MNAVDYQVTKYLIDLGAPVNAKDKNGMTALMYAADRVRRSGTDNGVIELLIDADADVQIEDNDGKTAIDYIGEHTNISLEAAAQT